MPFSGPYRANGWQNADPLGLGLRADQVEDRLHRHATPLGDARPALNAEVLRDLLMIRQRTQLREREVDGVLDQPLDPKPATGEVIGEQGSVFLGVGLLPVAPEVRRDVALGVFAGRRIDVFEQALGRPDQREPDALHDAGVAPRT